MATANPPHPSAGKLAAGCTGDSCVARDPWPLHNVRHRGAFIRLCTSCVLKHHPGSFCCRCFAVLDTGAVPPPPPPERDEEAMPVVHCSKCPSVAHLACLPNPDLASQFVCPSCENHEGFSFFPMEDRRIDLGAARVLLAAARLAAGSISRAAASARVDAERKAREAATARKRAREMLERAIAVARKQRERTKDSARLPSAEPPKKKAALAPTEAGPPTATRRVNNREVEKWMRFHEMGAHTAGNVKEEANSAGAEEKGKIGAGLGQAKEEKGKTGAGSGQAKEDKGKIGAGSGQAKEEKGKIGAGSGQAKEEKGAAARDPEKGARLPPSAQG